MGLRFATWRKLIYDVLGGASWRQSEPVRYDAALALRYLVEPAR
jgi:hypothetical protein